MLSCWFLAVVSTSDFEHNEQNRRKTNNSKICHDPLHLFHAFCWSYAHHLSCCQEHLSFSLWTVIPLWSILLFIWLWMVKQCSLEKIQAKVFGLSFCWINIPLATGIMHFGLAIGLENTNQMNLFSFSTPIYLEQQTFLSQVDAIPATHYNQRRVMDTRSSLICVSWYLSYIC